MFRLIVVLILSQQGTFSAGIDVPSGLLAQSFRNDAAGVDKFYEFIEQNTPATGAPYAVCLVRHGAGEYGEIGVSLVLSGVQPSVLTSTRYAEFAGRTQADATALATAARACSEAFPRFSAKAP
jgi:hypothetical protein